MSGKNKLLAAFLLIFISIIWGSSFILIKKGLSAYNPLEVGLLRVFFAFIVLLPVALIHLKKYIKSNLNYLLLSGIIGNFIPAFLFAIAQTRLASGITGVLNSLTPLFTLLIGLWLFNTEIKKQQLLGIFIGFFGSALLSLVNSKGDLAGMNVFVLFVIAGSACYGFNLNLIKKYLSHIPAIPLTALAFLFVGPVSILFLFFTDVISKTFNDPNGLKALFLLAVLGIVNTAFALVLFNKLLKMISAIAASSVTYLIPIVALILGMWDDEKLFFFHFIGIFLILLGVYLINRKKKNEY